MATPEQTVEIYNAVLQRDPTDEERDAFVEASQTPESEAEQIELLVNGEEANQEVLPFIRLYQSIFARVPDAEGLDFWTNVQRDGTDLQTIVEGDAELGIDGFANAPEFVAEYGEDVDPTDEAFITQLYENLLGRAPDEAGLEFFTNLPEGATIGDVVVAFSESPEFQGAINGQIDIFLTNAAEGDQDYAGSVYDVNDDGVVDEADEGIVQEGGGPGDDDGDGDGDGDGGGDDGGEDDPLVLAEAADETVTGTDGDDTIEAKLGTGATLNDGDSVDGGEGSDTLEITSDGAAAVPETASVTGVETVNYSFAGEVAEGEAIDAAKFEGAEAIWQEGADTDVENLDEGQTTGFRGTDGGVRLGYVAAAATAAVALEDFAPAAAEGQATFEFAGDGLTTISLSGTVADGGTEGDPRDTVLTLAAAEDGGETTPPDAEPVETEVAETATAGAAADATTTGEGGATDTEEGGDALAPAGITTIDVALDSAATIALADNLDAVTTFNASESTGSIYAQLWTTPDLETATTGSGSDVVALGAQNDMKIGLGAGDDILYHSGSSAGTDITLSAVAGTKEPDTEGVGTGEMGTEPSGSGETGTDTPDTDDAGTDGAGAAETLAAAAAETVMNGTDTPPDETTPPPAEAEPTADSDTVQITSTLANIQALDGTDPTSFLDDILTIKDFSEDDKLAFISSGEDAAPLEGDPTLVGDRIDVSGAIDDLLSGNPEDLMAAFTAAAEAISAGSTGEPAWATFQVAESTYLLQSNGDDVFGEGDGVVELADYTGDLTLGDNLLGAIPDDGGETAPTLVQDDNSFIA